MQSHPTPEEIIAHANEMRGIADTAALISTWAAYYSPPKRRMDLIAAIEEKPDPHYDYYTGPTTRALRLGVPMLQQAVAFSEMAAIGFAYQHAKKFCDLFALRDQLHKLAWADLAFIVRGCFFHDMLVKFPIRRGKPLEIVRWNDVELRRSDHENKALSREHHLTGRKVHELLDAMVQSALAGYQR